MPVRLKSTMKILIVDDHVLFREGLVSLLANHPDLTVVGEAGSAGEAVTKTCGLKPDLVLIDLHLPDGGGPEVIKKILSERPETRVAVMTFNESEDLFISAIRNGAVGYLSKKMPLAKLLLSLRAISRGEAALSRTMASYLVAEFHRMGRITQIDESDAEVLTPREMDVLKLLGKNVTNQEIADHLVIAENTVKVHVHNILEKLNFQNRNQAGNFARRLGL